MRRHRIFLIVLRNAVSIRQAVSFRLQSPIILEISSVTSRRTILSRAIDNLHSALQRGMQGRLKVGGFPYLAENLRRAGVTRNLWQLPACQKPGCPCPFLEGDVQIPSQAGKELQDGACLGFDDGFHQQLSPAVHHRQGNRFFVNVHADILQLLIDLAP